MTRQQRREQKKATEVFNRFFNEFMHHAQMNTYQVKGFIMYQPGFTKKFRSLHEQWKYFVTRWNRNPKRSLTLKFSGFADKVQEYINNNEKQSWISYTKQLMEEKYGLEEANTNELAEQFDRRLEPNEAAIEHVMKIKTA